MTVDVWPMYITSDMPTLEYCKSVLSPDEIDRCHRRRLDRDRRSYAFSRGALRILLSYYLSIPPGDIRFAYGERGKPSLASPPLDLRFNASHSVDIAVYSVARGLELGIDIEKVRPVQDIEQIARHHFCAEEFIDLLSLPVSERHVAFFRCWTMKEAYIKATGDGLAAAPLDCFRVAFNSEDQIGLIHVDGNRDVARSWTMHEIIPADGYVGALAYQDDRQVVNIHPAMQVSNLLSFIGNASL
jgi:4'-phosphopantetheinyl transferase